MMKQITPFIHSFVLILLFSLLTVRPVFAHGDDARIEISPERLNPGGVLEIRGVSFEPESQVTLFLVGPPGEISLGVVLADMEGLFQLALALPVDLAEGSYVVRGATDDDHSVDSPQLAIWGSADLGSADGESREEEDGLLAPMPTIGPGIATPVMASASGTGSSVPAENSTVPSAWIAAGIGIIVLSLILIKLKR